MLTNALKSTSVLALCAAMMAPPAIGQSSQSQLDLCGITGPFPCVLEDGTVIADATELARWNLTHGVVPDDAPADQPPTSDAAPDAAADADTPPPDIAVEDPQAPAAGDAQPAQEPPAEPEPAPDQPAAEEVAPPADQPLVEDPPVVDAAPADQPVVDETPLTDEQPADRPVVDEEPAPEVAPAAAAEAGSSAPQPRPQSTEPAVEELPAAAAAAADAEAEASGDPDAAMDASGAADVTVEEVTAETARSSGEEFETAVGAENRAPEERSGMSDFERALLIGLGVVAVGTILYNGAKVVSNSGDRIVVRRPDGTLEVLKNDDETLRRPGSEVVTRTFDDGSVRTVVTQPDGTQIITIRAANGMALKRTRVLPDGSRYVLFDDTIESQPVERVVIADRPAPRESLSANDEDALRAALLASMNADTGRSFSLRQIRQFKQVRDLAPMIEVAAITFDTGSAVIKPSEAEQLAGLGIAIRDVIRAVPGAVFLIEGHTDAVGDASYNLALSDRRAESVALALTEYFDVPPENLITQGYGESELKILTNDAERRNRRANVRNITPLLR
jgi:outer membrane protein OmpA-like peptidoglycan-associated protein